MKLPWHHKTGIPKAITIIAIVGILAFGLCTASALTANVSGDNWFAEMQTGIVRVCAPIVAVSLIAFWVLVIVNAFRKSDRSTRKP